MNKELKRKYRYGTRRQKTFIVKTWRAGFAADEILWALNDGVARPLRWRKIRNQSNDRVQTWGYLS